MVFRVYVEKKPGFVVEAQQLAGELRTILGLTVTTEHVILCDGDRYEITSVEDVKGRGMYLEVLAKRVEAAHG